MMAQSPETCGQVTKVKLSSSNRPKTSKGKIISLYLVFILILPVSCIFLYCIVITVYYYILVLLFYYVQWLIFKKMHRLP